MSCSGLAMVIWRWRGRVKPPSCFCFGGETLLALLAGGREGRKTVDESEFDNAVASAAALGDRGGVQGHYVLTFISITLPANSALASLQASRKCNKIEGCVLSSRSEEELQKGRSPGAQLVTAFQKGPAVDASRPRAKIFWPSWLDWARPLQKVWRERGQA